MTSVEALREAWDNPGTHPAYHYMKKNQLKKEWPLLYSAIIAALKS